MLKTQICETLNKIKRLCPLIHCITNPISITRCADSILSLGARPIMAEHPKEVIKITENADALLLNLGNITDVRMKSMLLSGRTAMKKIIPCVLDAVGISCSVLRKNYAKKLIRKTSPAIIKGNYSEILALYSDDYKTDGVDAAENLSKDMVLDAAISLSGKYGAVILASGKEDIITDGKRVAFIKNGTEKLGKVTGTGCMLGAICACGLSVAQPFTAATFACAVLGVSGEEAGNNNFICEVIERFSEITLENKINIEVTDVEKS